MKLLNVIKKIGIIASILLLSSCSNLMSTSYNADEYNQLVDLTSLVIVVQESCATLTSVGIAELQYRARRVNLFVTYSNENQQIKHAISLMSKDMDQFAQAYATTTPTPVYCQLKMHLIETELKHILTTIGGKPR